MRIDLTKFLPLSLWVLPFHCGDAWGVEALALLEASEPEARGVRWVNSPRHADVLLLAGAVPSSVAEELERLHARIPEPKLVVWIHGVGQCDEGAGSLGSLPVDVRIEGRSPGAVFDRIFKALDGRGAQGDGSDHVSENYSGLHIHV